MCYPELPKNILQHFFIREFEFAEFHAVFKTNELSNVKKAEIIVPYLNKNKLPTCSKFHILPWPQTHNAL